MKNLLFFLVITLLLYIAWLNLSVNTSKACMYLAGFFQAFQLMEFVKIISKKE